MKHYQTPISGEWQQRVPTDSKAVLLAGLMIISLFFGAFGWWAFRAPLAGAAIASGVVVASGENQTISHFEGGIIHRIAVKRGDKVLAGQPLVYLDETQERAKRNRIEQTIRSLSVKLARADAELSGSEALSFSANLIANVKSSGDEEILELERAEFSSRLAQHHSELNIQQEQVNSIEKEIAGIARQIKSEEEKLALLNDEIAVKQSLLNKGLAPKSQVNSLKRSRADTQGRLGTLEATLGQRQNAIAQIRQKQISLRAERTTQASTTVNELRRQLADLEQQLSARADVLDRMVLRSPSDGVVVNIAKNTVGSVVASGETILELLPTNDELVISAHIAPKDVDVVKVGQQASIRFSTLNVRTTPEVAATVEYISADRILDKSSQEPYFAARLRLTDQLPEEISSEQIFAGMPVETFIKTSERTFVDYLMKPVSDSFSKAFREE